MTVEQIVTIQPGAVGLDFAGWRPTVTDLRAASCTYVLRYVGLGSAWKRASVAEIQSYIAAGIAVILIAEAAADSWTGGYATGAAHGRIVADVAKAMGYPKGLPLVPGWDTNVNAGDQRAADYGNGFADIVEADSWTLGVYADLDVIRMLQHRSTFNWLAGATSWSGGKPETQPDYGLVHVRQVISGSTPNYDRNITLRPFRAWLPHDVKPPVLPPVEDKPTVADVEITTHPYDPNEDDNMAGEAAFIKMDKRYNEAFLCGAGTPVWLTGEEAAQLVGQGVVRVDSPAHPSIEVVAARAGCPALTARA